LINKATISITVTPGQSKVYGTNDPSAGFAYTPSGLFGSDSISGKLGRAAGETVATNVTGYAYNLGNIAVNDPGNYNIVLSASDKFAITPATLTITGTAGQSKVFGTNDPFAGFTYTNTGLVTGVTPTYWNSSGSLVVDGSQINDTVSGKLGRASGENVGNYAYAIGSVAASDPTNYTTILTTGTFAITKATITINPTTGQTKVFGTNDPSSGFTYGQTGLVSGVTPTYWNSNGSLVADGNAITDTLSGHLGRAAGENVGSYSYNLGGLVVSDPSNYNTLSLTAGTFGITTATLMITGTAGQSKVFGTNDPSAGFTYTNTGLVTGVTPIYWNSSGVLVADGSQINDTVSGKLGRAAGENVGSYNYVIGSVATSDPSNYTTSALGSFAITTASLTIIATTGQSKVFGTNDPSTGFTYTNTGLVSAVTPTYWSASGQLVADGNQSNDTISGNLGRAAGENVGNYAYNLGSVAASDPSNYNTSLTAGTFAITPASLTITATTGQSKVYGTNDPSLGFTYNDTGLVTGVTPTYWSASGQLVADGNQINDTISGNLGRAAGENVGTYAFNIGSLTASDPSNYNTSLTAGTFAITPS
jgi:hypothetical protein